MTLKPSTNSTLEFIRVMIVDDSAAVRGLWRRELNKENDIQVVAAVENGKRAVDTIAESKPDLVLLDIEMPEMDGITALPLLLKAHPGVRVIMASSLTHQGSSMAVHALALGASDYIAKPSSTSLGTGVAEIAAELKKKIRAFKYPTMQKNKSPATAEVEVRFKPTSSAVFNMGGAPNVLVIGCSTGGPNALVTMLKGLDFNVFKIPILVVQHMPSFFIKLLAERVSKEIGHECHVVQGGEVVGPGYIGIAQGDFHTEFIKDGESVRLKLNQNAFENYCRPSVDPLFRSACQVYGARVMGVVLTGMGEDGKNGCENIRKSGGFVIAQDEQSSVVWGMPGAVVKAGFANTVLPLDHIADSIHQYCKIQRRSA